ncbi:hypothetical protein QQP08_004427 [Theobroma cacao]|nr:hypothetical protein QQP08_004427 [Theobroma cacao]
MFYLKVEKKQGFTHQGGSKKSISSIILIEFTKKQWKKRAPWRSRRRPARQHRLNPTLIDAMRSALSQVLADPSSHSSSALITITQG